MANVAQRIEDLLVAHLAPQSFSIMDDSHRHAGHAGARAGGESHFTVMIVSKKFIGLNAIARHREVYTALKPLLENGLHALIIDAKTPDEAAEA